MTVRAVWPAAVWPALAALLCASHTSALTPASLTPAALTLTVASRHSLPGPAEVAEARWLPSGARALYLGSRLVTLDGSGQPLKIIPTPGPCQGLAVSPDGTRAATVHAGGVAVWNLQTGQEVARVGGAGGTPQVGALTHAGFRDSATLLVAGAGGLSALDLTTGVLTPLRPGAVTFLGVSPDGQTAILAESAQPGSAGSVRVGLVDTQTFAPTSAFPCAVPCPVRHAAFSADGRVATVQAGSGLVALRPGFPSSTVLRSVEGTSGAAGVALRDGTVLTLNAGAAESRDLLTGRREKTVVPGGLEPWPLQVSATGRVLAVTTQGQLLDASPDWKDVKTVPLPARVQGGGLDPQSGAVLGRLADGRVLAVASGASEVSGVSATRALPGTFWAVQSMNKSTLTLSPDGEGGLGLGQLIAGSGAGGGLRRLPSVPSHTHLSVNHWGNHAATWDDETLQVVSQVTGKVTAKFTPPTGLLADASVTLSPDATRAFVFPEKAEPYVVTLQNAKRFALPVQGGPRPTSVQISGQGVLAYALPGGTTALYRPTQRTPYATVQGGGEVTRFSSGNASAYLAVPVTDARGPRVDLVRVDTGQVEATTPPLAAPPSFLTWSADNTRLVVGAGLADGLESVTVFEIGL